MAKGAFSFLANPWVIGGGVVIGAIILFSGKGSGGGGDGGVGATLASMQIAADVNKEGMNLVAAQSAIAGEVAVARMQQDAGVIVAFMETLTNLRNVSVLNSARIAESNSGVINNLIQSRTALALDRQQNANRIGFGTVAQDPQLHSLDPAKGDNNPRYKFEGKAKTKKYTAKEQRLFGMKGFQINPYKALT